MKHLVISFAVFSYIFSCVQGMDRDQTTIEYLNQAIDSHNIIPLIKDMKNNGPFLRQRDPEWPWLLLAIANEHEIQDVFSSDKWYMQAQWLSYLTNLNGCLKQDLSITGLLTWFLSFGKQSSYDPYGATTATEELLTCLTKYNLPHVAKVLFTDPKLRNYFIAQNDTPYPCFDELQKEKKSNAVFIQNLAAELNKTYVIRFIACALQYEQHEAAKTLCEYAQRLWPQATNYFAQLQQ